MNRNTIYSGMGLPTENMTPWERLELNETTAIPSVVRRTYRRKSLEWHPDRWTKYPARVRRKAEKVYQLLSEGYAVAMRSF